MTTWQLVRRSLTHYWRTNVAVVLGVATAVAVLAGALLVGHSVRGSLADLVRQRLGATDFVIASPTFFREQLAADIAADSRFSEAFRATPLIVADAVVTAQESGRRAGRVKVYGVDERFWRFHGRDPVPLESREALLSPALAREVGANPGTVVLVRVQRPSDIPLESLHSRKEDVGRTLRVTTRAILDATSLGEFSLDAQQGDVMAVFVPLERVRAELEVGDRVNTILIDRTASTGASEETLRLLLRRALTPEDVGFTVKASDDGREVIIGSSAGLLDEPQRQAIGASATGAVGTGVFTYLANTMRVGDREVPYSLVTGIDLAILTDTLGLKPEPTAGSVPIVLNTWAAQDLAAKVGDRLTMEYYVWQEPGSIVTRSAEFLIAGITPIEAGGKDLAPEYPGISNTDSLSDWDPPFPLDLRRVRKIDEDYWDKYRATPKAFIPLDIAMKLWGSRYGSLTSVRYPVPPGETVESFLLDRSASLGRSIDPGAFAIVARDIRTESLAASQGATDFGEYFVYFSFFLVVSALVLVVLFFKLGVEQRVREVGLLRAVGLSPGAIRRVFTTEGLLLSIAGSVIGAAGAVVYAGLLIKLLTTRWVDAVGTTALTLHVSAPELAAGAVGGVMAAVVCIWWTLRSLRTISERSLLAGDISNEIGRDARGSRLKTLVAFALAGVAVTLTILAQFSVVAPAAGFFGAGALLLVAALMGAAAILRRPSRRPVAGTTQLAVRNASYRPGRSVLSMAVIASATFILVTVDAFRRNTDVDTSVRTNGTGGYELFVRTLLPVVHDPNSAEGRDALNLMRLDRTTTIEPFRVRPGDDASCLNLYQPKNPRIIAPRDSFLAEGRFVFAASGAETEAERANPWLLLNREEADGAVPVIGDANSMQYVLHRAVGDEMEISGTAMPVRLKFVASLSDSIFQSELLISERNFRRLFPEQPGYQMLLVDTTADAAEVRGEIEQALGDSGADAVKSDDYLASFHRVENTYLSTFQTLGGLGLLLGTVGLATVLLRNVIERRRELALLSAVGYRRSHFVLMASVENIVIVLGGLVAGAACAAIAIAPAVFERGGRLPLSSGALLLLFSVFVVAMVSSLAAMLTVTRGPLLDALRSE